MSSAARSSLANLCDRLRRDFADHSEIAAAWLFGSVARGEARADSDLDVAVLLASPTATAADHSDVLLRLALDLEADSGRRVDLVVFGTQGVIFCHRVLSEGILIFESDPVRRADFESTTVVRYIDFLPTYQIAQRAALDGFRQWFQSEDRR
ncbi:MAG: nucleotidyltransferase domain-containing protein [Deltaproteobacteria bacterium]|nr:nucleotidyltransferase domain-containing protein [Deltaproteobacteria bacterium]